METSEVQRLRLHLRSRPANNGSPDGLMNRGNLFVSFSSQYSQVPRKTWTMMNSAQLLMKMKMIWAKQVG